MKMSELDKLIDEDIKAFVTKRKASYKYPNEDPSKGISMFFFHTKHMFLTDFKKSITIDEVVASKEELINFHKNALFQK